MKQRNVIRVNLFRRKSFSQTITLHYFRKLIPPPATIFFYIYITTHYSEIWERESDTQQEIFHERNDEANNVYDSGMMECELS